MHQQKFSKAKLAMLSIGLAALVFAIILSDSFSGKTARPEDVVALFHETQSSTEARAILTKGLRGNPMPTEAEIDTLRKKVLANLQQN
jgi:hypothetical protein